MHVALAQRFLICSQPRAEIRAVCGLYVRQYQLIPRSITILSQRVELPIRIPIEGACNFPSRRDDFYAEASISNGDRAISPVMMDPIARIRVFVLRKDALMRTTSERFHFVGFLLRSGMRDPVTLGFMGSALHAPVDGLDGTCT